jgi:hypothetical protein
VTVQRHESATRGEERRGQVPPPPREASQAKKPKQAKEAPADGWEALQAAWNNGKGERWRSPAPPAQAADRLTEAGWLDRATEAIGHLAQCRYFKTPVTLGQFCGSGFVDRVLGGQYDRPKEQRPAGGYRGPDDKPPAEGFRGDDAARFEATRRKMLEQLKAS